jgi:hypothetical protein
MNHPISHTNCAVACKMIANTESITMFLQIGYINVVIGWSFIEAVLILNAVITSVVLMPCIIQKVTSLECILRISSREACIGEWDQDIPPKK